VGLLGVICFDQEMAVLTIVDTDEPSVALKFTSPMATVKLGSCHDVQNLGAVHTYLRRYLYVNALEVAEHDELEHKDTRDKPKPPRNTNMVSDTDPISEGELKRLCTMITTNGWSMEDFNARLDKKFGITSKTNIPKGLYKTLCDIAEKK
jgi:hypothetical protein